MRTLAPIVAGMLAAAATFGAVTALTEEDAGPVGQAPAAPATGRALFARMGCGNCHRLAAGNGTGRFGPNLDEALQHHTRASLLAKISNPGMGSSMPRDFGQRMDATELNALVSFLLEAREDRRQVFGSSCTRDRTGANRSPSRS